MEARKEPTSTGMPSYLPTNSDFHNNLHQLMSGGGKIGLNQNMKQSPSISIPTSSTLSLTSSSSSLTPSQYSTPITNTALSSRHLPFPYNINNFHGGNY